MTDWKKLYEEARAKNEELEQKLAACGEKRKLRTSEEREEERAKRGREERLVGLCREEAGAREVWAHMEGLSKEELGRQLEEVQEWDEFGDRPVHLALGYEDAEEREAVLGLLIGAGADLDAANTEGETALRMAARYLRVRLVEQLLRGGCGTTEEHIKFEHVWSDAIEEDVQRMEWQMWTRITGEMPTHSGDGWRIEERDFDGRKKGEEGWMEDWPVRVVADK